MSTQSKNVEKHWWCFWCLTGFTGNRSFIETAKIRTLTGNPDKALNQNKTVECNTTRRFLKSEPLEHGNTKKFEKLTPACKACIESGFPEELRGTGG